MQILAKVGAPLNLLLLALLLLSRGREQVVPGARTGREQDTPSMLTSDVQPTPRMLTGDIRTHDPGIIRQNETRGGPIEAPAIVYHGDYYYLFVSFDLCCRGANRTYKIMVGRAESITGPYVDRSGKQMGLGEGDLVLAGDNRRRGPGGQSVFLDGNTHRLVYHAYNAALNGMPQLQIRDLTWSSDGWPSLGQP